MAEVLIHSLPSLLLKELEGEIHVDREPMAREPHARRGRRSLQSSPLQHHLEDEVDADLDRLFGSGKARRRDTERRNQQYAHLAEQLFEIVWNGELRDPALEGLVVDHVELQEGSAVLTLWVARADRDEDPDGFEERFEAARGFLRAELARHLPRKRIPEVRVRLLEGPSHEGEPHE